MLARLQSRAGTDELEFSMKRTKRGNVVAKQTTARAAPDKKGAKMRPLKAEIPQRN
jgi:hypothetical protein